LNLEIYPKKIFLILSFTILVLLLANIAGIVLWFYFDRNTVIQFFTPLVDFNTENNIPTLYSSLTLMCSSLLLFFITSLHKKKGNPYLYWLILAILFLFLSIDETASIHEMLIEPVTKLLHVSGFFFYAWVIPYGVALVLLSAFYMKFLFSLPKKIMYLFLVSGATFVTGSIGFELLGGRHHHLYGDRDIKYSFLYTCEESLEMLGIAIFIYTLLLYISCQFKPLSISISEPVQNR
jgi:hypothetical protein